jgi:hypothetical protein
LPNAGATPVAAQRVEVLPDDDQDANPTNNAAPPLPPARPAAAVPGNNNNAAAAPPGNAAGAPVATPPVGGGGAGAPVAAVDVPTAQTQLAAADRQLQAALGRLEAATRQAIQAKLEEAKQALHTFSHHSLTQQMQEHHKEVLASIMALANAHEDNEKAALNVAVQNYHAKLLQLANGKLKEINRYDQPLNAAYDYMRKAGFTDPTGASDAANATRDTSYLLSNLGSGHSHIKRIDPKSAKEIIVHLANGVMSSTSPEDLANVAKAMGYTSFEFTSADTTKWNNGKDLRNAMKAMIRAGVPKISVDENLQAELADKLGPASRSEFDQLLRICAASTAVADTMPGNHVFGAGGVLLNGLNPALKKHEVLTFMQLEKAKDRQAYLSILYPNDSGKYYSLFTDELARAGFNTISTSRPLLDANGQPQLDANNNPQSTVLNPQQYFEQEILPREHWKVRSGVTTQYNDWRTIPAEFEAAATLEERGDIYRNSQTDATVLEGLAESPVLSNADRKTILHEVFDDAQEEGEHPIALNKHIIGKVRDVKEAEAKEFLNKAAPLIAKLATATDRADMITELRTKTRHRYEATLAGDTSKAVESFYKNKMLIDALEAKTFADQSALLTQHTAKYQALAKPASIQYFIENLSPTMQLQLWVSAQVDMTMRAEILKGYIDRYAETGTADAKYFLENAIAPLLAAVNDAQQMDNLTDELEEIFNDEGIHGCNAKQNQALALIRGLITHGNSAAEADNVGPTFEQAADKFKPAALFQSYFIADPNTATAHADKLRQRIDCYVEEMGSGLFNPGRFKEFEKEVRALGIDANNQQLAGIIERLNEQAKNPDKNALREKLINRVVNLQPRSQPGQAAGHFFRKTKSVDPDVEPLIPRHNGVELDEGAHTGRPPKTNN